NVAGRPLVFLNACASARERQGPPSGEWEATVSSVAYAFLFGGAVAVVGTLADVSDRHAATLAEALYRPVLEPTPIGEALRAARARARGRRGGCRSCSTATGASRCCAAVRSPRCHGRPPRLRHFPPPPPRPSRRSRRRPLPCAPPPRLPKPRHDSGSAESPRS